jgi:hypothetical protein
VFRKLIIASVVILMALPVLAQKSREEQISTLFSLIDRADEMVVYSEGFRRESVIYRSSNRSDFDELKSAITLKRDGGPFICACVDGPEIALLKNKKEIAAIWNHEGIAIGSSVWQGDWENSSPDRWLRWFDARRMTFARQQFDANRLTERKAAEDEQRWLRAIPSSLKPLWAHALSKYNPPHYPDLKPLNAGLLQQYPDTYERIRALMAWYGSGAGPWSGFPGYEEIAEKLLLQYPNTELIKAVDARDLSEPELEGAARILGGWRPVSDPTPIPADLRETLLNHCLQSKDEDKVGRAKQAFGSNQ